MAKREKEGESCYGVVSSRVMEDMANGSMTKREEYLAKENDL